jgi:Glycosyl hydrolase family 9.
MHAPCHLHDGSAIGHDLTGGWHDCGDHFKPSETIGYTAYALATIYLVYQDKAEDRYGNSYADTAFTDDYPDVLYEAKIGADYIFKLYKASKADGLIEKHQMYHTVGNALDHGFWDLPKGRTLNPMQKAGPIRDVTKTSERMQVHLLHR